MADALATDDESADPLDVDARLAQRFSRRRHAADFLVEFDRQIFQMVSHCRPPLSNAGCSGGHSRLDKTGRIIEPVEADAEDDDGDGEEEWAVKPASKPRGRRRAPTG